jgi:regulator of replication initiation timing
MNRKNHRLTRAANAVLLAAGLLGASVASAQTATTAPSDLVNENAQLRAELQKVEQRLDQVEAQQNQANKPAPASAAANAPTNISHGISSGQ